METKQRLNKNNNNNNKKTKNKKTPTNKNPKPNPFAFNSLIILKSEPIAIFCLVTETKRLTFREIPGDYSTTGAVDYTAVIFSPILSL